MVWVKLDDRFPEHPKAAEAGERASWLFVCALCYSARNKRDGFIPDAVLPRLATNAKRLAGELERVGLFEREDTGWRIHDYHDYQPASSTERVRRFRERNANGDG